MPISSKHSRPGDSLRRIRARLGLTTRRVAELSQAIATQEGDQEFSISHARLVQIENEESVPSIFKLFSLSAIYGISMAEVLALYIELEAAIRLHISMQHVSTHPFSLKTNHNEATGRVQSRVGVNGSLYRTNLVRDFPDAWGQASARVLDEFSGRKCTYAFIGLSDRTMYPLIRPGSFVQIQHCPDPVPRSEYRTEFDRPIYFIETRLGYICSWCEVGDGRLLSIPHPLSPCKPRQFAFPTEAEIVGRVTAVAARLTPCGAAETQAANARPHP